MNGNFPCFILALALGTIGSGCGEKSTTMERVLGTQISLPDGKTILAETLTKPDDMMRGMMFRDSLAPDRGMLFVHEQPGLYPYWMYQVRIPLDIIWIDPDHRVVEIAADAPPCQEKASQCQSQTYGGHERARFVLELGGGMAKRHGLKIGDTLSF